MGCCIVSVSAIFLYSLNATRIPVLFLSSLNCRAEAGVPGAIDRAVGDAYVALLMLCPKDLSWVSNPTQVRRSLLCAQSPTSSFPDGCR